MYCQQRTEKNVTTVLHTLQALYSIDIAHESALTAVLTLDLSVPSFQDLHIKEIYR